MSNFKGPAVDPEAFRVEGHCCGIRLPVLKTLTDEDEGLRFELTPEARAQLVAEGLMRSDQWRYPPKTSERRAQRNTISPSRQKLQSRDNPAFGRRQARSYADVNRNLRRLRRPR